MSYLTRGRRSGFSSAVAPLPPFLGTRVAPSSRDALYPRGPRLSSGPEPAARSLGPFEPAKPTSKWSVIQ